MELYRRYAPLLIRKCERVLKNRQDAEDVVHSLFVEIVKKGDQQVELSYLYRAATNRCLNLIRDKRHRAALMAKKEDVPPVPVRTYLENRVVSKALLINLVAHLDKQSCEILVYRYLDDLSHIEIADLMQLSRKTVNERLKKISEKAIELFGREDRGPA